MNISEIVSQLKTSHGVSISEAKLSAFLNDHNLRAEDITEATIATLADELKPKSAIAKTSTGKVAKNKRSTRDKQTQDVASNFKLAIQGAVKASSNEIDAMSGLVDASLFQYEQQKAESIVDRLRQSPINVLTEVGRLAAQEEANPSLFRDAIGGMLSELGITAEPDQGSNLAHESSVY
jgi:hypothetical protein